MRAVTRQTRPRLRHGGRLCPHHFLTTDKLESGFRYGSDLVTLVADAAAPGGLGTFGWDDEGVAAQRVPLVSEGVFHGYLSSRDSAPQQQRRCCARRRLEPAAPHPVHDRRGGRAGLSLEDIIADTDDGLYLKIQPQLVEIDDRRLNFQFGVELARKIEGGRLGRASTGTPPTRASRRSSGVPAMPWPTSAPGCSSVSPIAARGSPARACTSAMAGRGAPASAMSKWGSGTVNGDERGLEIAERAVAMALDVGATQARGTRHPHAQRPDSLRQQRAPPERGRGGHGRQPALRGRPARRRGLAQPPPRRGGPGPTGGVRCGRPHACSPSRAISARCPPRAPRRSWPAFASATVEADPEVRAAAAASSPPPRRWARQAFSPDGSEEVSVANSLGIRVSEPRSACPGADGHDGARWRHRLRRAGGRGPRHHRRLGHRPRIPRDRRPCAKRSSPGGRCPWCWIATQSWTSPGGWATWASRPWGHAGGALLLRAGQGHRLAAGQHQR